MRRAVVPGIATATLALALTACGGGGGNTLSGGGSSAQTTAQGAWTAGYQSAHSDITINYDPVGSGTGRTNFFSGAYSFAGSDSALSTDPGSDGSAPTVEQAQTHCGAPAIEVPAYISPIAVVFKLDGVTDLNLSSATVADIFSGKVTTWNDPEIAADNKGVTLPSTKITPVHRSDPSGTTANFTDWMSKTSDGAWSADPSDTWPETTGASGQGTSGLIDTVNGADGTIGYADDSAAGDLSVAAISVGTDFVKPSADGAAQALADSPAVDGRGATDMAISIDRTDTKAGTYPLILVSYLIACPMYDDATTADNVKGYLAYAVSTEGQQAAADAAKSAPLPADLATKAQGIVNMIAAK